jgi:hypothetical protein
MYIKAIYVLESEYKELSVLVLWMPCQTSDPEVLARELRWNEERVQGRAFD